MRMETAMFQRDQLLKNKGLVHRISRSSIILNLFYSMSATPSFLEELMIISQFVIRYIYICIYITIHGS